jgi:Gluconate 2-dehydrogenase subunit 3
MSAPMTRRDAVKATSLLVGGAWLTGTAALSACTRDTRTSDSAPTARALTDAEVSLMEMVADTILPGTAASTGARAAGVGAAIQLLLTDCYPAAQQQRARDGLAALQTASAAAGLPSFAAALATDRTALLLRINAEASAAGETHWFHLLRELSQRAYFSSEVGMTKALRYVRVPGRWVGCVPLAPGQPAWG